MCKAFDLVAGHACGRAESVREDVGATREDSTPPGLQAFTTDAPGAPPITEDEADYGSGSDEMPPLEEVGPGGRSEDDPMAALNKRLPRLEFRSDVPKRGDATHCCGAACMTDLEILDTFSEYQPKEVGRLYDASCNMIFE